MKDPKVSQQDSQQNRPEMEIEIEIEGRTVEGQDIFSM